MLSFVLHATYPNLFPDVFADVDCVYLLWTFLYNQTVQPFTRISRL